MNERNSPKGFPNIQFEEEDLATRPLPLEDLPKQARIDHEMAIINRHHERIGKAITAFWGHRDCVEYLKTLILSGSDGVGHKRIGFKPEVLTAMMHLMELHEIDRR
jgi:hypothetical protein